MSTIERGLAVEIRSELGDVHLDPSGEKTASWQLLVVFRAVCLAARKSGNEMQFVVKVKPVDLAVDVVAHTGP